MHAGAKEVFKKVSHAYSVLIDEDKRAHYDRFGPEEEQQRPQRRGHPNEDFEFQEMNDLFRAFFGQMPMDQRGGAQGPHQDGQHHHQQQTGGFNFFYLFLILFMLYTLAPLFQSKPSYSLTPSGDHRFRVATSVLNVEFFASEQFFEESKSPQFKKKVEMAIDREHIAELERRC